MFRAPQRHAATQTHFSPNGTATSRTSCRHTVCPYPRLQNDCFVRDFLQKSRFESARRAFRTRRPPKVTRQVSKTSFVRDFLQKSHVKSAKRAFRTRLPQKVTRQVCKTSVSYGTSSKSHTSSLQNERFVRDFLKKSHVKSAKRAFRTRHPQKLTCQSLQNKRFARDFLQKSSGNTHRSTHITQPCQAVSRFQPLQTTPAHTPIPMSQRHSPLPQLTASRFPAPATNLSTSPRLTRTKYCACHEMSPPSHLATSRFPTPATKIALPRLKTSRKYCACHEK